MSEIVLTLEYNGVEKTFADWGFAKDSANARFYSLKTDVFSVAVPGKSINDEPMFPFEAAVIIRRRTLTNRGELEGDDIEFQGVRVLNPLRGEGRYEGVVYQFHGPFYHLENTQFEQDFTDYYGTRPVSDLVLFFNYSSTPTDLLLIDNGEQIRRILQFLLDTYADQGMDAPFQIGSIAVNVNLPTYPIKEISCADALQICLQASPDATLVFDHSVQPPRVNVGVRSSMIPATVALGNGIDHKSIDLTPRPDLVRRAVVIYFNRTDTITVGDVTTVQPVTIKQKYGPNGEDSDDDPDRGLRVLTLTVDLEGSQKNILSGSLDCGSMGQAIGSADARRDFWSLHKPEFASSQIRNLAIEYPTVLDDAGNPIDLSAFPNFLLPGSGGIAPWMKLSGGPFVTGKRAKVTAVVSYDLYDVDGTGIDPFAATNGTLLTRYTEKQIDVTIVVTNGVTGDYKTTASQVGAEPIPEDMARDIYLACAEIQYNGEAVKVAAISPDDVSMANVLNLSNGRTEWLAMNAVIQGIERIYGSGESIITIGEAKQLSIDQRITQFLINRKRLVLINPVARITGDLSASGDVRLQKNLPAQNTTHGLPARSNDATSFNQEDGNTAVVRKDAENKNLVIEVRDPAGAIVAAQGRVDAKLSDVSDMTNKEAKFRLFNGCDAAGSPVKMKILATQPEAV